MSRLDSEDAPASQGRVTTTPESPSPPGARSSAEAAETMEAAARQYVIYVQTAEALVDRRAEVNRFYLTLNTALFGAIGFLLTSGPAPESGVAGPAFNALLIYLPGLPLIGIYICRIWRDILLSQRAILGPKFQVIHKLEERLPLSPYEDELRLSKLRDELGKPSFATVELRLPSLLIRVYAVAFVVLTSVQLYAYRDRLVEAIGPRAEAFFGG